MTRPARPAAVSLVLAAVLIAGCGSTARPAPGPAAEAPPGGAAFLATATVTAAGTWAVAVMGGSVGSHNNFWQLFARPAGTSTWRLVTPPGTADNGGLVLADAGRSLITAFRPSQYLTYTPLSLTRDGGQAWSTTGPLDGALANVPDALAAVPATGQLLALLASGTAKLASPGYARWSTLVSQHTLAATEPGRSCGLRGLTAAAFTLAGAPLLAGACSRPGTAGIFAYTSGTWHPAGPALPASYARQNVTVLRLITTAGTTTTLLSVGTGPTTRLLAAWSTDGGAHWALSPPLPLHGAQLASVSSGPAGSVAIVLSAGHAQTIAGPTAPWQPLPALPVGTATLAPGPAGGWDALAVHSTKLAIWQLATGGAAWAPAQTINVPIQFGSSG